MRGGVDGIYLALDYICLSDFYYLHPPLPSPPLRNRALTTGGIGTRWALLTEVDGVSLFTADIWSQKDSGLHYH
jgi:hypothetical protein